MKPQEVGTVLDPHFVGEGVEGQSCQVACPRSRSNYTAEPRFKYKSEVLLQSFSGTAKEAT